jgi:predicted nuclease of predicted toxin-antitoxin system
LPHAGILRLVGLSALQQAEVTLRVIQAHGADLAAGAIVTAEPGRLRVRPARAQD